MTDDRAPQKIAADFVITGATIVTQDAERRVIKDAALAVSGNTIVWMGDQADCSAQVASQKVIDGRRFILTPGFINGHVHITGDPLTRHYTPDDINDDDRLFTWTIPRYEAQQPSDEALSAKYCAVELLKSGSTTFLEAGTIRHLDAAAEGLSQTGIRGLIGTWVEGRAYAPDQDEAELTADAVKTLEAQSAKYPHTDDALLIAWPILVGHAMNSAGVWQAAKSIADDLGIGFAAHMSPYQADPDTYMEMYGCRPLEQLDKWGVLGPNLTLTHATHLNTAEVTLLASSGTNIAYCPFASLKGAFGVAQHGRYIEMLAQGTKIMFATDGYDCDMLPNARLGAAIFKDLAQDVGIISAQKTLDMITCTAAEALGLSAKIGSLEVGKRADMLAFDTNTFQLRPLLSPIDQIVWSADERSLHSVWVDGARVIEDGRATTLDEDVLLHDAQLAGADIIRRANLPAI